MRTRKQKGSAFSALYERDSALIIPIRGTLAPRVFL